MAGSKLARRACWRVSTLCLLHPPQVNALAAARILAEQSGVALEEGGKKSKKAAAGGKGAGPSLLEDDRFAAMFKVTAVYVVAFWSACVAKGAKPARTGGLVRAGVRSSLTELWSGCNKRSWCLSERASTTNACRTRPLPLTSGRRSGSCCTPTQVGLLAAGSIHRETQPCAVHQRCIPTSASGPKGS